MVGRVSIKELLTPVPNTATAPVASIPEASGRRLPGVRSHQKARSPFVRLTILAVSYMSDAHVIVRSSGII